MAEGKLCVCPQCGKKYKLSAGFAAASFSCKQCGATVWVSGKPPAPTPKARGKSAVRSRASKGGRGGRAPVAARGRGRRGAREEEPAEEGHGRGRYQKKESNTTLVALTIGGLLIVVGGVVWYMTSSSKKDETTRTAPPAVAKSPTPSQGTEGTGDPGGMGLMPTPSGTTPAMPTDQQPGGPEEATPGPGDAGTPEDGDPEAEKPARALGGTTKKPRGGLSAYDPPADMGHLEDTPADLRKQIDEQLALLFDPDAGRDSLLAKEKLAAIGKPAFPVILGKMAQIRDTITDNDTMEERLMESSLYLADQALRIMDGYCEARNYQPIRPGTDKNYIRYILKIHYKRWRTYLHDKTEMPGPYDPSQAYDASGDDEQG